MKLYRWQKDILRKMDYTDDTIDAIQHLLDSIEIKKIYDKHQFLRRFKCWRLHVQRNYEKKKEGKQ